MNIAIVAATLPEPHRKLGGVEVFIHRLANRLASDPAHQVTVFSLCDRPADALYQHQRLYGSLGAIAQSKLFVWFIFPLLLNFLDLRGFDVVHLHGDDWFFLRRPVPSVRTMHGSALNEARTATSLKRKLMQRLIYPLEHLSVRLATITAAVGSDSQDIYRLPYVIDIGVSLERFFPGPKAADPAILFVGTWEGRKRGQFMFEQFTQHILPQVPNAQLWMVSDHCPSHPRVTAITFPDDATLAQLYRAAWVFGYPSIYEGFGMAYVEALASGTAIVTSRNGGAEHILDQGTYGIIADDDTFAASIICLLTDATARETLETTGLQRATDFSWQAVGDRYLDLYSKAIAQFS
jgi:phosphatidyl-myo-inositol alpha-mannosyltransferase